MASWWECTGQRHGDKLRESGRICNWLPNRGVFQQFAYYILITRSTSATTIYLPAHAAIITFWQRWSQVSAVWRWWKLFTINQLNFYDLWTYWVEWWTLSAFIASVAASSIQVYYRIKVLLRYSTDQVNNRANNHGSLFRRLIESQHVPVNQYKLHHICRTEIIVATYLSCNKGTKL